MQSKHLAAIQKLAPHQDALKTHRLLRRLEMTVSRATTAQCNGENYQGQPYRNDANFQTYLESVESRVAKIFGGQVPQGFFVNTDPRGYALKIDEGFIPDGMATDWGRFGILAPEKI